MPITATTLSPKQQRHAAHARRIAWDATLQLVALDGLPAVDIEDVPAGSVLRFTGRTGTAYRVLVHGIMNQDAHQVRITAQAEGQVERLASISLNSVELGVAAACVAAQVQQLAGC